MLSCQTPAQWRDPVRVIASGLSRRSHVAVRVDQRRHIEVMGRWVIVLSTIIALLWASGLHTWHDAVSDEAGIAAITSELQDTSNGAKAPLHKAAHTAGHPLPGYPEDSNFTVTVFLVLVVWPILPGQILQGLANDKLLRPPKG